MNRSKNDEIHDQLMKKFREADRKYNSDEQEIPDFDFSFLDDDAHNAGTSEKKKKVPSSTGRRFAAAAACIIIVLLSANILLIATDSTDTYGDRGLLHRIKTGVSGLFTDEESADSDGIRDSISITDMKNIKSAKKFLPKLYVPGYLPEGYELKKLEIDEYYSGDIMGRYDFMNAKEQEMTIDFEYIAGDISYSTVSQGELTELPDRKIYVTEDSVNDEVCAEIYTEECKLSVTGIKELKNDIIKVACDLSNQ